VGQERVQQTPSCWSSSDGLFSAPAAVTPRQPQLRWFYILLPTFCFLIFTTPSALSPLFYFLPLDSACLLSRSGVQFAKAQARASASACRPGGGAGWQRDESLSVLGWSDTPLPVKKSGCLRRAGPGQSRGLPGPGGCSAAWAGWESREAERGCVGTAKQPLLPAARAARRSEENPSRELGDGEKFYPSLWPRALYMGDQ